jgi:hypothetical protein
VEAVLQGFIHSRMLFESDRTIDETTDLITQFVLSGLERKPGTVKGASR